MNFHLAAYVLLAIVTVLAIATYIRVRTSPAYRQRPDQVVIREPGDRRLGAPEAITVTGPEDVVFALLSQAAYQRKSDAKVKPGECLDADAILDQLRWSRWPDFADVKVMRKIEKVHLRVEVWWQVESKKVAVAFGGTVFTNKEDWDANLRWFFPHHQDQYTVIVKDFGEAFSTEYLKRAKQVGWQPSDVHLLSTGHSLGGGLAQEFAYSLPLSPDVPRVDKVYAFDPSPVTGYYSVKKSVRESNAVNLCTDRIYERGEILAIVRSITNYASPPSANHPTIRQIRYDLFPSHNPIASHSIAELACKLYAQVNQAGARPVSASPTQE